MAGLPVAAGVGSWFLGLQPVKKNVVINQRNKCLFLLQENMNACLEGCGIQFNR